MGKLTEITIKNLKVPDGVGKHSDGAGLYFELLGSGRRRWVYRYRVKIRGKWSGRTMVLGTYPEMKLAAARGELIKQKAILKAGEDPVAKRKEEKQQKEKMQEEAEREQQDSFENIALEFLAQKKEVWSKDHHTQVTRSLRKDAFPVIGKTPVAKVTPQDILVIIHTIQDRGSYEIASKVLQRIKKVCSYAVQTGRATYNPASEMKNVLEPRPVTHRKALPKNDLPEFFAQLSASTGHTITKAALKFVVLTTARSGEVRMAKWPEIDFSSRLWSIPAERMKMRHPHTIYLSDQAIKILKDMKQHATSEEGLVFPGIEPL